MTRITDVVCWRHRRWLNKRIIIITFNKPYLTLPSTPTKSIKEVQIDTRNHVSCSSLSRCEWFDHPNYVRVNYIPLCVRLTPIHRTGSFILGFTTSIIKLGPRSLKFSKKFFLSGKVNRFVGPRYVGRVSEAEKNRGIRLWDPDEGRTKRQFRGDPRRTQTSWGPSCVDQNGG